MLHQLLDQQEAQEAGQHGQANQSGVRVVVGFACRVTVCVRFGLLFAVRVRIQRVWNEVEEGVAQQAAGREAKQGLQQGLVLGAVVGQRDEEEDDEGRDADQKG